MFANRITKVETCGNCLFHVNVVDSRKTFVMMTWLSGNVRYDDNKEEGYENGNGNKDDDDDDDDDGS